MADANFQTALAVGVPTLAVLVGILIDNSRLNDLRGHMDARFDAMRETWLQNGAGPKSCSTPG